MKIAFLSILLNSFFISNAQEKWSIHLERANKETSYCKTFYELMKEHKDDNSTAYGYYAVSTMMLSKLYKNPFTKLSYFNKGKSILEEAIQNDTDNVELRFLRFAVQNEVPSILLYFYDIENDGNILNEYILNNDSPLAMRIIKYYQTKDIEYLASSSTSQ